MYVRIHSTQYTVHIVSTYVRTIQATYRVYHRYLVDHILNKLLYCT